MEASPIIPERIEWMNENPPLLPQINELVQSPHPTTAHLAYACLKWREKYNFDTVFLAVSGAPEEPITALAFDGKEELIDSGLYRLGVEERITLSISPYKIFSDITGKPVFNKFGSLRMQKPNGGMFISDFQPQSRFILFGLMHTEPKAYPDALLKELAGIFKDWLGPLNRAMDKVLETGYPSVPVKAFSVAPTNEPTAPAPSLTKVPDKEESTPRSLLKTDSSPSHSETHLSECAAPPAQTGDKQRRPVILVDEVTRLFNRDYFEESLLIEVERAKRYSRSVSLLFLEVTPLASLDGKENEVATKVAEILSNSLRRVDVICRLDGNRYAIVLPDTANHTYGIIAKRIFKYFKQIMGDQPPVTINLSASTYPQHVGNHLELYANTEKLLAQAKAAGPNKAVLPD